MRTLVILTALFFISNLSFANAQVQGFESVRNGITVYRDGVVLVVEQFRVNSSLADITVTLLSPTANAIFVTDQVKAPLSFDVSGQNITIHTLGATAATLEYQTVDLTKKEGAVWTVRFNLRRSANLTLPDQATITFLNAIPDLISLGTGRPLLLLKPGQWEVSYTLPVVLAHSPQLPQQQPPQQNPPAGKPPAEQQPPQAPATQVSVNLLSILWIPAIGIAAAAGGFLFYRMKRPSTIDTDVKLRPEEEQLLQFLEENDRKALESDLRKKFILPKTSMWRMAKRLERMGYVKINRVGFQNELELIKKP